MILQLSFGNVGTHSVNLPGVTQAEYDAIRNYFIPLINTAGMKSREAIADGFRFALSTCPNENPSDLYHHVIYRTYIEKKIGTNPEQSWVRTSGEGFEALLAANYNPILAKRGIRLTPLFSGDQKRDILQRMGIAKKVGSAKVDLAIEKLGKGKGIGKDKFGVVGGIHAKASLAERVSDDIPCSRHMMAAGLVSVLATLDVKSFPPPHGDLVNRGELGTTVKPSDKRKYIEEHGDFDVCFSYNARTAPSNAKTKSGKMIYVATLDGKADAFTGFLVTRFP